MLLAAWPHPLRLNLRLPSGGAGWRLLQQQLRPLMFLRWRARALGEAAAGKFGRHGDEFDWLVCARAGTLAATRIGKLPAVCAQSD